MVDLGQLADVASGGVGGFPAPRLRCYRPTDPRLALDHARSESRMQVNSNRPLSEKKEEEKRERGQRYRLIRKARRGDPEAIARLREEHSITKVWTQEEIEAFEGQLNGHSSSGHSGGDRRLSSYYSLSAFRGAANSDSREAYIGSR